jgi:hypothetical protein
VRNIIAGRRQAGDFKRLKLVDSKTFSTGVLSLIYQPAKE